MSKCACENCPNQFGCDLEFPCIKYFEYYYSTDCENDDDDEEIGDEE